MRAFSVLLWLTLFLVLLQAANTTTTGLSSTGTAPISSTGSTPTTTTTSPTSSTGTAPTTTTTSPTSSTGTAPTTTTTSPTSSTGTAPTTTTTSPSSTGTAPTTTTTSPTSSTGTAPTTTTTSPTSSSSTGTAPTTTTTSPTSSTGTVPTTTTPAPTNDTTTEPTNTNCVTIMMYSDEYCTNQTSVVTLCDEDACVSSSDESMSQLACFDDRVLFNSHRASDDCSSEAECSVVVVGLCQRAPGQPRDRMTGAYRFIAVDTYTCNTPRGQMPDSCDGPRPPGPGPEDTTSVFADSDTAAATETSDDETGGVSSGALIGIAVGVLAIFGLIAYRVYAKASARSNALYDGLAQNDEEAQRYTGLDTFADSSNDQGGYVPPVIS